MDSFASNKAFAEKIGVTFPVLSDWQRTATRDYGLFNEKSGYGVRGTFVVNKEGKIEHVEVGNTAIDPTGAYDVCNLFEKRKADAQKKP
jgi:peroxiredoxin